LSVARTPGSAAATGRATNAGSAAALERAPDTGECPGRERARYAVRARAAGRAVPAFHNPWTAAPLGVRSGLVRGPDRAPGPVPTHAFPLIHAA